MAAGNSSAVSRPVPESPIPATPFPESPIRESPNGVASGPAGSVEMSRLLSRRSEMILESGIRRVFEAARQVHNPINLSVGQPDFPVPESVKQAAIRAIQSDKNGYSSNYGIDPLLQAVGDHLHWDLGWNVARGPLDATAEARAEAGVLITAGTSGALIAAAIALLDPDDELIIPDPYFVLYPPLAQFTSAKAVPCETYPDFRLTAARVAPLITPRTKAVLLNSPGNPTGVVATERECRDLLELCRSRGILLISDEIYDEFTFSESLTQRAAAPAGTRPTELRCPSPCRVVDGRPAGEQDCTLVIRGFGKTFGCTGWRLGYCAGPAALIRRMVKIQQHLYICAPTPLQWGVIETLRLSMSDQVRIFERRRDEALAMLSPHAEVPRPGGAFYLFVKVPERLGIGAWEFCQRARERRVIVVPSMAFGSRDTHFRISMSADEAHLREGLQILADLLAGK